MIPLRFGSFCFWFKKLLADSGLACSRVMEAAFFRMSELDNGFDSVSENRDPIIWNTNESLQIGGKFCWTI